LLADHRGHHSGDAVEYKPFMLTSIIRLTLLPSETLSVTAA